VAVVVAVAQAAVLIPIALVRFVDGDEGVYAYASRLAIHGEVPYRDFFFEQAPLFPYVYGGWTAVAGESWPALRLLSVAAAVAVGVLLYAHVRSRAGLEAALAAVAAYAGSALVFGYLTLVKTFALTTLLVFGAYVVAARGRGWLLAGLLLGLAVDTRLLLVAVVPLFAVVAARASRLWTLAGGFAIGALPTLVFFLLSPRAFLFDNVRYHSLKTESGLVGDFHEKGQTAATLLGLEPTDRPLGIQFALLLCCAVAAWAWTRRRRPTGLALSVAAMLGFVSFLPTPTYVQYFAVAVPFLTVAAAELVARAPALAVATGIGLYLVPAGWSIHSFTRHDPLLHPSIDSVEAVASRVDALARNRERVLASWPGYLVGTHAWALSDYTNQFAPVAAARISPERANRFHVVREGELERRIRERSVRVVVYRNWVTSPPFARWDAALVAGRYGLVTTVQTARIYRR
jgi:4-amino-4-deoxy-L-arabinose transferase-like glycosyltransferase